jgi:hypothetical protein
MKIMPILFCAEMVRALLDGRKTQTRRLVKDRPPEIEYCKYMIGDLLWVRETFIDAQGYNDGLADFMYRADVWAEGEKDEFKGMWTSSIFMPRAASRITLEITGVRVERLQDISDEDSIAEGAGYPSQKFMALWQSINGKESWDSDPWVWVIEFKTHGCNIDKYLEKLK